MFMKTILPLAALSLLTGIVTVERRSPQKALSPGVSGEIAVCGPSYQNLPAPMLNGKSVTATVRDVLSIIESDYLRGLELKLWKRWSQTTASTSGSETS